MYQTNEDCAGSGASDCKDVSVCKQLFMERQDRYCDYIPGFTYGSWDENSVTYAVVFSLDTIISMRLPDSTSIFTAEMWAIIKVLAALL